jgi:dTDP-4-dehydrorhamnose reductase
MTRPVHLVVGADGLVGNALVQRLRSAGESMVATTRRRSNVNDDCLYLDLAEPLDNWRSPSRLSVATICAGITKAQACKDDPTYTSKVNVERTSDLIGDLVAAGAFVIFISTNQVFDGAKPFQSPDASPHPVTEYGLQKSEVERRLAQYGDSVAIIRFAKILGPHALLIPGWVQSLRDGKTIHPFSDMTMAPIPLSCAVTVLSLVAQLRLSGILQVSGQEDISYAEAAHLGAKALSIDSQLIEPAKTAEHGSSTEPIPAHTTLNIDRLKASLGIVPPSVKWTIETAFANPQLLAGA